MLKTLKTHMTDAVKWFYMRLKNPKNILLHFLWDVMLVLVLCMVILDMATLLCKYHKIILFNELKPERNKHLLIWCSPLSYYRHMDLRSQWIRKATHPVCRSSAAKNIIQTKLPIRCYINYKRSSILILQPHSLKHGSGKF